MRNRSIKLRFLSVASVCLGLLLLAVPAAAQSSSDYDTLVQQGKSQLQSGNNDAALASANAAIKLDSNRWEAYAVAGGALINLKRCDEAKIDLAQAIKKAPEAKQAGLRDLTGKCVTGNNAGVDAGPSYADTVKWIQDHIRQAGVPGGPGRMQSKSNTETVNDQQFSVRVNGCESFDVVITTTEHLTNSDPDLGPPFSDFEHDDDFKFPIAAPPGELPILGPDGKWNGQKSVVITADTNLPTSKIFRDYSPVPSVDLQWLGDWVTLSITEKSSDPGTARLLDQAKQANKFMRPGGAPVPYVDPSYNLQQGVATRAVRISYGMPGTENEPDHMAKALQHLITLCRQNPGSGPKDMF